jgi:hypothetical protein
MRLTNGDKGNTHYLVLGLASYAAYGNPFLLAQEIISGIAI